MLTIKDRAIFEATARGATQTAIAKATGRSQTVIRKRLRRFEKNLLHALNETQNPLPEELQESVDGLWFSFYVSGGYLCVDAGPDLAEQTGIARLWNPGAA